MLPRLLSDVVVGRVCWDGRLGATSPTVVTMAGVVAGVSSEISEEVMEGTAEGSMDATSEGVPSCIWSGLLADLHRMPDKITFPFILCNFL